MPLRERKEIQEVLRAGRVKRPRLSLWEGDVAMCIITPVRPADKPLLWELLQSCLREMAPLYDDQPDESGEFPYTWFEHYFTDPDRIAFFLMAEDQRAGFAMINSASCIGEAPDHTIAEFYILPDHRSKGLGFGAAKALLEKFPGSWELKYHRRNRAAARLWAKLTAPYHPRTTLLGEEEQVLSFLVT